jgi:TonB-linked SusC/RagA family outer membrane protein
MRPNALVTACAAAFLLVLPVASAQAQGPGIVRGTVSDSTTRRGVPGAQISIVGSTRGAATNDSGVYVLRGVPAGTLTLRVQRLGYSAGERTVTVGAGETVTADVTLRPTATVLSTVVSVGYGTASRQNVTSAIASVDSTSIRNVPIASIDNAIQGKIAGVQVMQNSGEPGSGISVRIRGPASLNAGNQPLYVVDGVPIISGSFNQFSLSGQDMSAVSGLSANEIASIDVLKDAAATAIYGSRGSNGVVLITTKRGSAGRTRFSISAYGGSQKVERQIGLLDATQYVSLMNESAKNDGYTPADYDFVPGKDDASTYDWQSAVFRRASVSDGQLAVTGGSDRIRFYVSGGNFDQSGIVKGSRYTRQSGRVNADINATPRLTLNTSIGLTRENDARIPGDQSLDGVVTNAIGMQPMRPIYGSSFGYGGKAEGLKYSNPLAIAELNTTNFKSLRALGKLEAKYSILDRLSLTARAGADVYNVDELSWGSPKVDATYAASANGVGRSDHTTANRYILESYLTAEPFGGGRFGDLTLVGGSSVEYNHTDLNFLRGEGFPTGFTTYIRNAANITTWDGAATDNNLVGFFTRANWSLKDRYLVGASLRADGSSRFGKNNRYGVFPAASLGWVVTDEPSLQGLSRFGTLKLRGSYGITGNQGIGDFASLTLASGAPYSGAPGVANGQLGNAGLKWETTKESDVGADIGFVDGRISLIADWYNRNTSDLLVRRPVPSTSGYTTVWDNIGSIRNRGVDLGLRTVNLESRSGRGLGWTTDANVTWNKNVVTSLYQHQPITFTVSSRVTSAVAEGHPLGEFYMYKVLRVDPADGNVVFATAAGGETKAPTSSDLMFVGSPQPKYYGGLTNTFSFRAFDLRGFFQFSQGNKVLNMMRIFTDDGGYSYDNKTTHVLNRWQKAGDVTNEPRMSYDGTSGARLLSSRMVEDGSFVRLGEVTLGYKLPNGLAQRSGLESARLFVSGRNLKTWTKYSGYNPDVNSGGSSANVVMGVDYYAYPLARTFTVGLTAGW